MKQKSFGRKRYLKMYLVDTNIFLEVLLSRPRNEECKDFLRSIKDGRKSGVVTDLTIHLITQGGPFLQGGEELENYLRLSV